MAKKTHVHEVVSTNTGKVVAKVWWDGKDIQSEPESMIDYILKNHDSSTRLEEEDGVEFLKRLPSVFRSGYLHARKAKS